MNSLGNGLPFWKLIAISLPSVGTGAMDAVLVVFLIGSLQALGAAPFTAFLSITAGAFVSIIAAPLLGVLAARSILWRKTITLILLMSSALLAATIAFTVGSHSPSADGPRDDSLRVTITVIAAVLYRAAVQSAPIVPMLIDAAAARGDDEAFPLRRDLALSGFYLNYRLGFLLGNAAIALRPQPNADRLLPVLLGASVASLLGNVVLLVLMPSKKEKPVDPAVPSAPQLSLLEQTSSDIRATVLDCDRRLQWLYVETFLYGAGFGQIAAATASFYNEVVFGDPVGAGRGVAWASYSALLGGGVSLLHDALAPLVVFSTAFLGWGMGIAWSGELWIGAGLLVALYFVREKISALVLFGALDLARAAHSFFSLIAAGALVAEPRLRPAAFGVRSAALQSGLLVGTSAGGALVTLDGFRPIVLLGAGAVTAAGFAAFMVGAVDAPLYTGVAANANELVRFVVSGGKKRQEPVVAGSEGP